MVGSRAAEPFVPRSAPSSMEVYVRTLVLVIASLVTLAGAVFAQTPETRGSAAAIVGGGRTWDDESRIGSGLAAGGRVDWRLFGNTRAEAAFDFLRHERTGVFESKGHTLLTSASLVQRFGSGSAQPYLLGGLTVASHSGTNRFGDGPTIPHSSLDFGYHFGGGLAVRVGQRFEIGPEARFYIVQASSDSDPAWANWVGVRFGARF
jgi:hypothetical protein